MSSGLSMSGNSQAMMREWLGHYLKSRWQADGVEILELSRLTRGISRETWLIRCMLAAAGSVNTKEVILRRDPPGNSIDPRSLRFEYEVYARLAQSAVPIARPLWYEADAEPLPDGREFYLREHVHGSWEIANLLNPDPLYDTLRVEASREHIRKLALVHGCDWSALGFGELMAVPPDAASCAQTALDRHFNDLERFQFEPFPVMTEAREWLALHAPPAPRICLLKGTNGYGEEIFAGGQIVAMSDWEQSSLGDPASDFARTQDFLFQIIRGGEQVWGDEQALAYYEQISGIRIPLEAVRYYRVLNGVETIVSLHHAARAISVNRNSSARSSWLSTEVLHRFQRLLLDAACGRSTNYSRTFFSTTVSSGEVQDASAS